MLRLRVAGKFLSGWCCKSKPKQAVAGSTNCRNETKLTAVKNHRLAAMEKINNEQNIVAGIMAGNLRAVEMEWHVMLDL